jgi:hypothetical protein
MKYLKLQSGAFYLLSAEEEKNWSAYTRGKNKTIVDVTDAGVVAYLAAQSEANKPKEVTMRQARLALLQAGLLDKVTAAIAGMPSPQKQAAEIEWEYSNPLKRSQPLVTQLGAALGMDTSQLDALFLTASTL